jgi:hypothetical protein
MDKYYVNQNAQSNGDHEVHKEGCYYLSLVERKLYLGEFTSCFPAVAEAKKYYSSADGCYYCCPLCHKS